MRYFVWLVRAFIFFTMFAFALNNLHPVTVHWFFGVQWSTQMVFVVMVAFAAGIVTGSLAMVPSWWRHRRVAKRHAPAPVVAPAPPPSSMLPSEFGPEHPPREGL